MLLAALATLSFGVVVGPEAPLILIGSGLGVLAVRLAKKDAPDQAATVVAAAGSFAAISSLLGSPIVGAFLLLEAVGLGGPMLGVVLVPGLLAAGVGTLVFIGLDSLTGFGTFSLAVPWLPPFDRPTGAMFGWAIAFGLVAPFIGRGIQLLALAVRPHVERRMVLLMPVLGLVIAGLAIGFAEATSHDASDVLFSGQEALGPLIGSAADWSVGALLLLVACKGLAYALSLSSFRGGPVFPAMYIGAAGGVPASDPLRPSLRRTSSHPDDVGSPAGVSVPPRSRSSSSSRTASAPTPRSKVASPAPPSGWRAMRVLDVLFVDRDGQTSDLFAAALRSRREARSSCWGDAAATVFTSGHSTLRVRP